MSKVFIGVDGMTCGHCSETIQKTVGGIDGVNSVKVNLEAKQVAVDFDPDKTELRSIHDRIKEAGFSLLD